MNLVHASGLAWMVDRICALRAAGENAGPYLRWHKNAGGVLVVTFLVLRANGDFELAPPAALESPPASDWLDRAIESADRNEIGGVEHLT